MHLISLVENSFQSPMIPVNMGQGSQKTAKISPVKCPVTETCQGLHIFFLEVHDILVGIEVHELHHAFCIGNDRFSLSPGNACS